MKAFVPANAAPGSALPKAPNYSNQPTTLFIACGALAKEIIALKKATGWSQLTVTCLPAHWHNMPEKIAPAVLAKIRGMGQRFDQVYVIYGDCGTGGELDRMLEKEKVERIPGPHCYQFLMGADEFTTTHEAEPGCLYLTDYLVQHFDRIIFRGLGLDRYPQLLSDYFGNYTKLIYVSQIEDQRLQTKASKAAKQLGLAYDYRHREYGELGDFMRAVLYSHSTSNE